MAKIGVISKRLALENSFNCVHLVFSQKVGVDLGKTILPS